MSVLQAIQITHVVWVPDSVMGRWETAFDQSSLRLVRVCREGEAWPLAAGLYAGGARPLVMMQTTGLFESGDALRNVMFDLKAPVYGWIGVRNWLNANSTDSARRFALPLINAWQIDYVWIESAEDLASVIEHYHRCQSAGRLGVALLAEGAG